MKKTSALNNSLDKHDKILFTITLVIIFTIAAFNMAAGIKGGASTLPSCLKPLDEKITLVKYANYFRDHSNVARAMNPCKIKQEVLQEFFNKLEEAENTGLVPDAPLPDEYFTTDTSIDSSISGGAQSAKILGAKLAHILYIEVNQLVPWRLHNYENEDIVDLFRVCNVNFICDTSAAETGWFHAQNVIDHSPRVAWTVLEQRIQINNLVDQKQALIEIFKTTRDFRHGGIYYDSQGNIVRRDDQGIITMDQMAQEKISRKGCWSMDPYIVQLAAALNIPGNEIFNYYGEGHNSASFKYTDLVIAHGDHSYDALLDNTPSAKVFDSYTYWKGNVLRYKNPGQTAWYNARKHRYDMGLTYPSNYLMYNYCHPGSSYTSGRNYLEDAFKDEHGTYATVTQLDDLEVRINSMTNSCITIPPDNPENQ